MRGILADVNVGRHRDALLAIWSADAWRDLWNELGLFVVTFPDPGLTYNSPDTVIWWTCQRERLVLITGNRNNDGPDSLEAVIRNENQPEGLPVITISRPKRLLHDRLYAEAVAEGIIEFLIRIDEVRGAGRLYVP